MPSAAIKYRRYCNTTTAMDVAMSTSTTLRTVSISLTMNGIVTLNSLSVVMTTSVHIDKPAIV
ncbi:hypothetical protein DPMN_171362 [Dreissena polymorpha]|uniref:Uncharacterized protein n=1 Tax=Dreissena polymorpha TaxID=45954 RepID=A0A9D4DXV1_DREPO|nr:hypothetical protein DPMN_171362 [Dreissena polymorpha]